MVISVSRRTDIPACFPDWFIHRIRAGFVNVPNPRYPDNVTQYSLRPADVDCFAFWTKNPGPLIPYLDELDSRGFKYFFHYTITGYPKVLEPNVPSVEQSIETLLALSERCGPRSIIWRYDPILISTATPLSWHKENYARLSEAFGGQVGRCFVSPLQTNQFDVQRSLNALYRRTGVRVLPMHRCLDQLDLLMPHIVSCAANNGIELRSCREDKHDLTRYGIQEGICVDKQYIDDLFEIKLPKDTHPKRDPECRCYWGPDLGMYSTCRNGCAYCYAINSPSQLAANLKSHRVDSPSLLGWFEPSKSKPKRCDQGYGGCSLSEIPDQQDCTVPATKQACPIVDKPGMISPCQGCPMACANRSCSTLQSPLCDLGSFDDISLDLEGIDGKNPDDALAELDSLLRCTLDE
jgi:hypothetical protein